MAADRSVLARSMLASSLLAFAGVCCPIALGQDVVLKNDRFPADPTTVTNAQMSIQAGFEPGEIAAAVLAVPTSLRAPFRIKRVQYFWTSTSPGSQPVSLQDSIVIYRGSVLTPNAQLVYDSVVDGNGGDGYFPQLEDGGLNEFDLSPDNIIVEQTNFLTIGLRFAEATNQIIGPSVTSDRPPNNASLSTPGRNAIFGTWPELGITSPTWFEPRVNLLGSIFGISGNFFIRAIVEPASTCPADLGQSGGITQPDGQLDNNDFVSFVTLFFARDPRADLGRQGGLPGADGEFSNDDFVMFISRFFEGCN